MKTRYQIGREVAVDTWIAAGGDQRVATRLAREQLRHKYGLDPATIIFIIRLCVALYKWWASRRISHPAPYPMQGEPTQ